LLPAVAPPFFARASGLQALSRSPDTNQCRWVDTTISPMVWGIRNQMSEVFLVFLKAVLLDRQARSIEEVITQQSSIGPTHITALNNSASVLGLLPLVSHPLDMPRSQSSGMAWPSAISHSAAPMNRQTRFDACAVSGTVPFLTELRRHAISKKQKGKPWLYQKVE